MKFNVIARAAIARENEIDCACFAEWGYDYKIRDLPTLFHDAYQKVREDKDALRKLLRDFPCNERDALLSAMSKAEHQLFKASMDADVEFPLDRDVLKELRPTTLEEES